MLDRRWTPEALGSCSEQAQLRGGEEAPRVASSRRLVVASSRRLALSRVSSASRRLVSTRVVSRRIVTRRAASSVLPQVLGVQPVRARLGPAMLAFASVLGRRSSRT